MGFTRGAGLEPSDVPPRVYFDEGGDLRHGDLAYRNGQPILVVSWRRERNMRIPHIYYELEIAHLDQLDISGRIYRYTGPLIQPKNSG